MVCRFRSASGALKAVPLPRRVSQSARRSSWAWTDRTVLPSRAERTPQTILQTAPCGAVSKRAGVHLVDDPHLLGIHLDALDQGPQDLAPGSPGSFLQALRHTPGELVQLAHDRLHRLLLGRTLRSRPGLGLQRLQPLPGTAQPWLELPLLQQALLVGVDQPCHDPLGL